MKMKNKVKLPFKIIRKKRIRSRITFWGGGAGSIPEGHIATHYLKNEPKN